MFVSVENSKSCTKHCIWSLLPECSAKITNLIRETYIQICNLQFTILPRRVGQRKHTARSIDSFSPSECWQRFRTRKEDLHRILITFKLDVVQPIVAGNRSKFTGVEILLIGLHHLTFSHNSYHDSNKGLFSILIIETFRIVSFHDYCTVIATCRPGGGPRSDGTRNTTIWFNKPSTMDGKNIMESSSKPLNYPVDIRKHSPGGRFCQKP